MKIGIVILATNSYSVLGIRLIKRFMQFYKGKEEIKFFFFSDVDPAPYIPDEYNVEYIHTTNKDWVEGTNLKFISILSLENRDVDYLAFFDADTNVDKDFTEEWFIGESVGGQHFGDQSWMKESKGYERNPHSKAYIPFNTTLPQIYYYGAFFLFTKNKMMEFCKLMISWQKADREWGYEPPTHDEGYKQNFFHYNPPSKLVLCTDFKFLISDKGGIGETRFMGLNVEHIKKELKLYKNKNINIAHGKVTHED
jgi:hypothetical protein